MISVRHGERVISLKSQEFLMIRPERRRRIRIVNFAALTLVFLLSRLAYMKAGVRFDWDPLRSSLAIIDPELLRMWPPWPPVAMAAIRKKRSEKTSPPDG